LVIFSVFIANFEDNGTILHEGDLIRKTVCFFDPFDDVELLIVDHELAGIFVADRAFPASVTSGGHEGDKCLEVEALSMLAFTASDWHFDEIPSIGVEDAD
jgi:hypothetical protein